MAIEDTLSSLRRIGLSRPEEEMVLITDEPKIPGYLCFPNEEAARKFRTEEVFGQGFDPDRSTARVKSIGEFLERLCLYNPEEDKFVYATYSAGNSFMDPAMFCCYSEEQLDRPCHIETSRKERLRWCPAKDIRSGEPVLVPAQMVFLTSIFDDEFPVRKERISTGAALGKIGTDQAFVSGLMETIERDACMSSYLSKRKIRKIVELPAEIEAFNDYLRRYCLETHVFDVTTDLKIPSVLAVTLDRTGIGAAVNVGSRADLCYVSAIKYAMLESIHCRRSSRLMRPRIFPDRLPNEDNINSLNSRFFYWHALERIHDIDFWLNSQESVGCDELMKNDLSLASALGSLFSRGYHVLVTDITLPEIRAGGFEALKVLIPELHPLYLDEHAKALYSIHYGAIPDDKTLKPHPVT